MILSMASLLDFIITKGIVNYGIRYRYHLNILTGCDFLVSLQISWLKLVLVVVVLGPRFLVQVCAWSVYLFLSWWALCNNLIWSCILCYGHEVMRVVNTKTAGKTYLAFMTENAYILQLQQKIYLPGLVVVIGEKVVLSKPGNPHH